jgi:DNA polymerase-4
MLCVGNETYKKLIPMDILTIGDLAKADGERLKYRFGKVGLMLKVYANGYDMSSVNPEAQPVKSVGHSNTLRRDAKTLDEVRAAMYKLSEGVAIRLRGHGLKCRGVQIYIRDKDMFSVQRQGMLAYPTNITNEIAAKAFEIFQDKHRLTKPIRTIGVKAIELVNQNQQVQMDLFGEQMYRERLEQAENAMDRVRERFGKYAVIKGGDLASRDFTGGLGQGSETNPLIELFDKVH